MRSPAAGRRTRVKVCCIAGVDEARLAIDAGADAVGLVGRMPSGPGPIPDTLIRDIAAAVPPGVDTFLLTSETQPAAVVDHVGRCGPRVVQLVDAVQPGTYAALRRHHPGVRIVQVIHVEGDAALAEAQRAAQSVDAVLLDTGRPNAPVRELGGTGRTHDWSVSARIVESLSVPVYLAGGLRADTVTRAIRTVRPFGVDLCSGVRTDGALDRDKVHAFLAAVRRADGELR